ncbi:acyl carrier protein [Micromonospora sp. SH-82]|uniref:acyl carrier protein n=1 Tax=Micromonospora sp. SH-82 TaxID=3132938 RepID=UPI003EBFDA0A
MTETLPLAGHLPSMPLSERREVIEELVLSEFRTALRMDADEDLTLETGFFDLGLTSLRLIELRRRMENRIGVEIDATVLFSQPTIEQLVNYLVRSVDDSRPVGTAPAGEDGR